MMEDSSPHLGRRPLLFTSVKSPGCGRRAKRPSGAIATRESSFDGIRWLAATCSTLPVLTVTVVDCTLLLRVPEHVGSELAHLTTSSGVEL